MLSRTKFNILLWVTVLVLLVVAAWANRDYTVYPTTTGTYDLGTSTYEWRNIYAEFVDVDKVRADIVVQPDYTAASLTSPTVTIDASTSSYFTVTSDANQTGVTFSGAALGQLIYVRTGAGSNTVRFDDGTSMSLGGSDITFTEGQDDVGCFRCIDADGDEFERVFISNNS